MIMNSWIEDIIVFPTIFFACISVICDIYVIVSTHHIMIRLYLTYGSQSRSIHDYIICQLVYWLGMINLAFSGVLIPQYAIQWTNIDSWCIIVGFLGQFNTLITSFWHILFSGYLFYLLKYENPNCNKLNFANNTRDVNYHRIFSYSPIIIIFLSFVGSVLPLFYKNSYGILYAFTDNSGNKYGTECWLLSFWQLIAYGALLLSLLFDVIVLLLAVYKYYQTKWFTNAYLSLIKRLSIWVIIFAITRILPFIDRLLILMCGDNYNAPLWLVLAHNYTLASFGIANGIAWYFNRKIKPSNANELKDNNTSTNKKKVYVKINEKNQPFLSHEQRTLRDDDDSVQVEITSKFSTRWQSIETTNVHINSN